MQLRFSSNNLLTFMRIILVVWTCVFIFAHNLQLKMTPGMSKTNFIIIFYWVLWIVLFFGLAHSIKYENLKYIPTLFCIFWTRLILQLLDIAGTAKNQTIVENALTIIFLVRSLGILQSFMNFVIFGDAPEMRKYCLLTTVITSFACSFGVLAFTRTEVTI